MIFVCNRSEDISVLKELCRPPDKSMDLNHLKEIDQASRLENRIHRQAIVRFAFYQREATVI